MLPFLENKKPLNYQWFVVRSSRLSLTGGALNYHRRFPRLAMSGGFLRQLQSCGAHVQSTLRSSSFVSLNSLLLPSLGMWALYDIVINSEVKTLITAPNAPLVLGSWGLFFLEKQKNHWIISGSLCEATSYSHRGKPPTTIGARELNFRVRYGNGCDLSAIITSLFSAFNTRRYSLSTAFAHSVTYIGTLLHSLSCFLD